MFLNITAYVSKCILKQRIKLFAFVIIFVATGNILILHWWQKEYLHNFVFTDHNVLEVNETRVRRHDPKLVSLDKKKHGTQNALFVNKISATASAPNVIKQANTLLNWKSRSAATNLRLSESNISRIFDIMTSSDNNFNESHHPEITFDTESAEILLSYPSFNFTGPLFVNESHRQLFLKNTKVLEYLMPPDHEYTKGKVVLIKNAFFHHTDMCGAPSNLTWYKRQSPKSVSVRNIPGLLCPIVTPDGFAWQHFIEDVMPKIAQVFYVLKQLSIKILIFKPRDPIILQILDSLGIESMNYGIGQRTSFRMDYQLNTCITPRIHPILWGRMRALLGCPNSTYFTVDNSSVVLLTRAFSRNPGRHIENFKEVEAFLTKRYGDGLTIFQGAYNLSTARDFFQNARIIIGVHGGAFHNIHFCPRETTVVEVMPTLSSGEIQGIGGHTMIWRMAQVLGQTYWRLPVTPLNRVNDLNVPLPQLHAILDHVDKRYH